MTIVSAAIASVRAAKSLQLIALLGIVLAIGGCGPIFGLVEQVGEGMTSFTVVKGKLADLKAGSSVLVFGPFDKTESAYYICRGEDAARYDEEFRKKRLFDSSLHVERDRRAASEEAKNLRRISSEEIQRIYDLDSPPEWIVLGTLLERRTTVAPTRGVIMTEGYRLEFYSPKTRSSVIIESYVKIRPEHTVPLIVEELVSQLRKRS